MFPTHAGGGLKGRGGEAEKVPEARGCGGGVCVGVEVWGGGQEGAILNMAACDLLP